MSEIEVEAMRRGAQQLQQVGGLIGMSYQAAHGIADESFSSVVESF